MVLLSDKHPIDLTIGQELPPTFHYAWVILANFLAKVVGREPTMDEILQIIYLRKAARRFS